MTYGKGYFITESQAKEIRTISADRQKEEKRKNVTIRRSKEDIEMCREFGITINELNQGRMYQ